MKLIDAAELNRYAVIPGIFKHEDPDHSHCFVQILDGNNGQAYYYAYPLDQFSAAESDFDVRIGPNHFWLNGLALDLAGQGLSIKGRLRFEGLTPWPVRWWSPGAMGWYAWVPFMECYHGVLSFDHALRGTLQIQGEPIAFDGGRGYMEKDWGVSFPSGYIWLQSNHFPDAPGSSLMASIAVIPWLGSTFPGFIIGWRHKGMLYRFATYTGAHVEDLTIGKRETSWVVQDRGYRGYRLEVEAQQGQTGTLHSPGRTEMAPRVAESLSGTIRVRFWDRRQTPARLMYEGKGRHAGVEITGDTGQLLKL